MESDIDEETISQNKIQAAIKEQDASNIDVSKFFSNQSMGSAERSNTFKNDKNDKLYI